MIEIRPATIEDIIAISELVVSCTNQYIAPSLSQAGLDRLIDAMAVECQRKRINGDFRFFVATDSNDIVGTSAINPPDHLYYLFVKTGFQGRGIGQKLLQVACSHVAQQTDPTQITVNSSLNSIEFYRRYGFVETGPVKNDQEVVFQPMRLTQWPLPIQE